MKVAPATHCACGTRLRKGNRERGSCDACEAKASELAPETPRERVWAKREPKRGPKLGSHLQGRVDLPGLNEARKASGMTKADLAYAIGVSESAMSEWLYSGGGVFPEVVEELARVLGTSTEKLKGEK